MLEAFILPRKLTSFRCPGCGLGFLNRGDGGALAARNGAIVDIEPDAGGWLRCCTSQFRWEE